MLAGSVSKLLLRNGTYISILYVTFVYAALYYTYICIYKKIKNRSNQYANMVREQETNTYNEHDTQTQTYGRFYQLKLNLFTQIIFYTENIYIYC